MSFSSKSKFAGFLRGLIGRSDDRASARPVASAAPASASAPAPTVAYAASGESSRTAGTSEIELPLAPVLAALPMEFRAKLMATPSVGQGIYLQAEMVINQLAFGAVKITFGDLRRMAPGIFASTGGELDGKLVSLPLQEILPRINSALLARRSLKKVEVSDEIIGPFSERGRGFSFTTQPLKAAASARAPLPEPAPAQAAAPIPFTQPPLGVRPAAPSPMAHRSVTPGAPANGANGNSQGHTTRMVPFSNRSVTPASPTGLTGHANGNTNGYGNGHVHESTNGHGQSGTPGLRLGPLNGNSHVEPSQTPAPAPLTSFPCAPQTPPQPAIFVNLIDLCDSWPESLKVEIQTSSLAQANIPLDGNIVVPGMKRGRVVMFWKQLRLLALPASPASPHDNLELELPLKVLAPLFLASQKSLLRPKYRGQLSTDIPDLFFGFPQPAPAAPVAPTPVSPIAPAAPAAPVLPPLVAATPVVPPLPKSMEKVQDTNFYVWGENGEAPLADEATLRRAEVPQTDFMSRQTHPKEIVGRAMALPGVAGSVVAMPDGMRIASQVPVELNADTVAAFLPQIFDRVNQSTRELRMGPLNNVNFTVGNVPWKIFRVNAVYFATFGRAGEQLPSAQLAQLAAELDRKK